MSATMWKDVTYSLRFGLGDKTLFRKNFPALMLVHDPLREKEDGWKEHLGTALSSPRLLVIRSYPVSVHLPPMHKCGSRIRYVTDHFRRYFVTLDGTYDDYLSRFSAKTRNTLRRKVRKFMEMEGGARFEVYRSPDEIERFWGLARQVSRKTYQEKLLDAGLPDDPQELAEARALAEQDRCRGYLLSHGDVPVAYIYLQASDRTLRYAYLGFDPVYAEQSAGTVLHCLMLESLFQEGSFTVLDFTEGEGPQKQQFGTDSRLCANILYVPGNWSAKYWFFAQYGVDQFSVLVGKALDRFGLKAKVRRWMRGQS